MLGTTTCRRNVEVCDRGLRQVIAVPERVSEYAKVLRNFLLTGVF